MAAKSALGASLLIDIRERLSLLTYIAKDVQPANNLSPLCIEFALRQAILVQNKPVYPPAESC